MNKLFLILIAFMWTLPRAVVFCDDLDFYIESGYNKNEVISAIAVDRKSHYESECLAEGDAGSHFTYSWEFVSTCSGMSGSRNGYVKSTATCNICTGQWVHDELEEIENACREDCRASNYVCQTPSFPEQWGGEIVKKNSNGGACGDLLPNCSESSSSESVESSSSEGDDSSSSFDGSSSSEKAPSSSMNGRYDLVYDYEGLCEGSVGGVFCSIDCGTGKHYMRKPGFVGPKKLYFWCSDYGMEIRTNIPEIFPDPWLHIECHDSKAGEVRGLNVPDDLPLTYLCYDTELSTIEGCPTTESVWNSYDVWSVNVRAYFDNAYYASSISDLMDDYYRGIQSTEDDRFPSNYSRMDLLNEPEFVSFFSECKRRMKTKRDFYSMIKEEFGDSVWQGDDPWNTHSPYVFEFWPKYDDISSYEDYCRSIRGENSVLYQIDSLIYEEYYDAETSQISKDYIVLYYCAPAGFSSSSAEESSSSESSSSSEKSSSSEESSSSEPPSSSSLSSSSEESSSSSEEIVESSSVMPVDEPFVAGADQVYTPDQIFSSGLQNMEPGACYSLNPDRGTIYGWNISYNASDSWWWRKVDCETGKKPVENGIGICAAFPGSKPDKISACYSYKGSCYVCDNSKDYIDCNADWLWNYNFPTHSWFKQVDCYDPFGEDDEEIIADGCIDESILRKQLAKEYYQDRDDMAIDYSIDFTKPTKRYDVLGRKVSQKPSQRIILFNKKTINEKQVQTNDYIAISGTITVSSDTLCDRLSSGEWVCGENRFLARRLKSASQFKNREKCDIKLGRDYGIIENDNRVGGMTCAWPNVKVKKTYTIEPYVESPNGYAKIIVNYTITSITTLGDNDHLTVKKGYVFPDGHVTTSAEENQFDKHEKGHEFYNKCVIFEEINMTNQFECIVKLGKKKTKAKKNETIKETVEKELADIDIQQSLTEKITEKINEGQKKLDAMVKQFHKDYGIGGYSDRYTCPTD